MAIEVATLIAKLEADIRDFERDLEKANRRLDDVEKSTKKTDSAMGGLTKSVKGFALAAGAAFGAATITNFAKDSLRAFSDLSESVNAVNVVFEDSAGKILAFGETASTSVGLSNAAFNQLATNTGALLTNFGFGLDEAADKTIDLTTRAADLASVFNTDVSDALGAINSALRGETEPIRRYAIDVSEASLAQTALALGIEKSVSEMTQQEKAALRLEAIMAQSAKTAGDFANTSDSLANRQRILAARFEDAKAAVGKELAPAMTTLLEVATDLIPVFGKLVSEVVKIVQPVASVVNWLNKYSGEVEIGGEKTSGFGAAIGSVLSGPIRGLPTAFAPAIDRLRDMGLMAEKVEYDFEGLNTELAKEAIYSRATEMFRDLDVEMAKAALSGSDVAEAMGWVTETTDDTTTSFDRVPYMEFAQGMRDAIDPTTGLAYAVQGLDSAILSMNERMAIGRERVQAFRDAIVARNILGGGITPGEVITRHQTGGVVPGPMGQPRLALVHGGEEVLTPQQRIERNVTVNMNGPVTTRGMLQDELTLALLMAGVNEHAEFRGLSDLRG